MNAHINRRIPITCLALLLFIASLSASAGFANITVGPGDSIQAAINEARPGDVIEVESGTYHEDLVIDKRLTLRGVDSGDGKPLLLSKGSYGAITLIEDGITFEGFRLEDLGIDVISDGNTIRENVIRNVGFGISLKRSKDNNISQNDVEYNGFMGTGLILNICENNIVKENCFKGGWLGSSIHLLESTNNVIVGNVAQDRSWLGRGIYLDSSNYNFVKGNNATGGPSGCSIALFRSNQNTIVQNNLTDNVDSGLKIYHSSGNLIYLNNFDENKNDPFSRNSTSFWYSPEPIVYKYGGNNFTARLGNFWPVYSGHDAEGDGIGDSPRRFEGGEDRFPLMGRSENYYCIGGEPDEIFGSVGGPAV